MQPAEPGRPERAVLRDQGRASGSVTTLAQQTWSSINCAFARLSQIVGLNRVVDTTYRMAESDYLYLGQPESEREPIKPFASYATGANEMSPLDMAAGMQTLANEGVHKKPYFVEFIDDADGQRLFTHFDPGTQVLRPRCALTTVDILKGVLRGGTARRTRSTTTARRSARPEPSRTTRTPGSSARRRQLTTAVWVGDPDAYTPMVGIPEFRERGVNKVQGGLFPSRDLEGVHGPGARLPAARDWDAPPPPARPNARLVLPGNECVFTIDGLPPGGIVPADPNATVPSTEPPAEGEEPAETAPPATLPPVPITAKVDIGTTIDPSNLDPRAPLPTIAAGSAVAPC